MEDHPRLSSFIAGTIRHSWLPAEGVPWRIVQDLERIIRDWIKALGRGYALMGDIAVHETATVENGAVLKGPIIVGPGCFVAAGAYLRGGVYLEENCVLGPGTEVKTSAILRASKLAHLNFVGDSIIGKEVNLEAGSIIANYRNECQDKTIRVLTEAGVISTGVEKFGALVGDGSRIGANAVLAPGSLLPPNSVVPRLGLIDQIAACPAG